MRDDETITLTHAQLKHAVLLAADEIAQYRTQRMHDQLAALQQRIDAAIEAVTTAAAERRAAVARVAGELAALQRELAAIQGRRFDEPHATPPEIH
jgi:uncharacterized coiled-coil protein SlyX